MPTLRNIGLAMAILTGSPAGTAQAQQTPPPPPCSAPEYRGLDFWVGDWALEFDQPDGSVGTATNRITSNEYGDCAIVEHFEMGDYRGTSYSMYDSRAKTWRQMWVDNGGGVFQLTGGPISGAAHSFELKTLHGSGQNGATQRMIWQDVTDDSLTWRWQTQQEDGSWQDSWVLRYKRR